MASDGRSTTRFKKLRAKFYRVCMREDAPCWLCGQPIDYSAKLDDRAEPGRWQLDHFHPVSKRPDLVDDPANFRPSHAGCNQARGNEAPRPGLGLRSRAW